MRVVVGGIIDPEAVVLCRDFGVGNRLKVEIGRKLYRANGHPLEIEGRITNVTSHRAVVRTQGWM